MAARSISAAINLLATGCVAGLAAIDTITGAITPITSCIGLSTWGSYGVEALAISGTMLGVGGDFTVVREQSRKGLAALDAITGTVLPWAPDVDGNVFTLAVSGSRLYVGGDFDAVNRLSRSNLAAFDSETGILTDWNPEVNVQVSKLTTAGGVAYAPGDFSSINGQPRDGLAAFDTITGALLPWKPMVAGGVVTAFAATAASVYIGINGQSEQSPSYLLAALDTTTGGTIQWSADLPISSPVVKALWIREDQVFANIEGSYNSPFTVLVSVDANNGRLNWEAAMEPSIAALAVSNRTAYIGYRSSFPYYSERYGLKGVDAMTGVQTRSNLPTANGGIYPLAAAGDLVYVGGWFTSINNTPVSGVAIFKEILYTNHVYMPIIRH